MKLFFKKNSGSALSDSDLQKISQTVLALNSQKLSHVVGVVSSPEQLAPNHKIVLAQVITLATRMIKIL